jgi:hypothetical protein
MALRPLCPLSADSPSLRRQDQTRILVPAEIGSQGFMLRGGVPQHEARPAKKAQRTRPEGSPSVAQRAKGARRSRVQSLHSMMPIMFSYSILAAFFVLHSDRVAKSADMFPIILSK